MLIVVEFKIGFQKLPLQRINYWDYKNFNNEKFRADVFKFDFNVSDLEGFKDAVFCIFNKHVPITFFQQESIAQILKKAAEKYQQKISL